MKIIFASNNPNKAKEIDAQIGTHYNIVSLTDLGYNQELEETGSTLEENAIQKAEAVHKLFEMNCFAEDTGLEVEALNMAPGIYSARYAGPQRNANDNMDKLLHELEGHESRKARFRTCIALIWEGRMHLFEGIVEGHIAHKKLGDGGFGYDPIFIPKGHTLTFAELSLDVKKAISHRAKAVEKLVAFLRVQQPNH